MLNVHRCEYAIDSKGYEMCRYRYTKYSSDIESICIHIFEASRVTLFNTNLHLLN